MRTSCISRSFGFPHLTRFILPFLLFLTSSCRGPTENVGGISEEITESPDLTAVYTSDSVDIPPAPPIATCTPVQETAAAPTPHPSTSEIPDIVAVVGAEDPPPSSCPPIQHLYLFDFDNKFTYRVIDEDMYVYDASWSPDGRSLAFSGISSESSEIDIYILDIASNTIRSLDPAVTGGSHATHPTWSPDGSELAFVQTGAGEALIYIMNTDGTDIRFLVEGLAPSWSPDGKQIVFIKPEAVSSFGELSVISVDQKVVRSVTKVVKAENPSFSPDGSRIVFTGIDSSGDNHGYFVINVDGSNLIYLSSGREEPSWLPDDHQIVAPNRPSSGKCVNSVALIDLARGESRTLESFPDNFYYSRVLIRPAPSQ